MWAKDKGVDPNAFIKEKHCFSFIPDEENDCYQSMYKILAEYLNEWKEWVNTSNYNSEDEELCELYYR